MGNVKWIKGVFLGMFMVLAFVSLASAEPKAKVITLKDGSVVQGVITGIDQGAYVVVTPALGTVRLKEDDVVSILLPGEAAAQAGAPKIAGNLDEMQGKLMSDPAVMAELQAIASDPEIVALVSDPAFMAAAQARDANAIQANPRAAQLMQNPKIKALIDKIQAANAGNGAK